MTGINKHIIVGNIGNNMKVTKQGESVLGQIPVFVNETWSTSTNETKGRTQLFQVRVWGKLALTLEPLMKKGTKVFIEGPGILHEKETEDGLLNRYYTIDAKNIQILQYPEKKEAQNEDYDDNYFNSYRSESL